MRVFLTKKPQWWALGIYFALAFSILALLQYLGTATPQIYVDAPGGAADLRAFDFTTNIARIEEAQVFPDVLLLPSETDGEADGHLDDAASYGTARVKLLVAEGDYLIYGKSPDFSARIFVNGALADTVGWIDAADAKENVYQTTQFRTLARPQNGEIEVLFHIAGPNYDELSYHGLFIGGYDIADERLLHDTVYGLIPVIIFITCALFYFGYFLFMPSQKSNLWFALIAFTVGIFISYNWKIGYQLFPYGYNVEYMGFHISLLSICVYYSFFVQSLFKTTKTVPTVVCVGAALLALLFAFLPIELTSGYLFIHTVFVFSVMAVNLLLICMKIKSFRMEHIISFCGQIVFMLSGVLDLLGFRLMEFWDFSGIGMLVFLFSQMASLYLLNNQAVENEQKMAAEYAALEETSKWKEGLLRQLSHELKTPLTVISNVSQLARMQSDQDYVQEKLDIAIAEVEGMKDTVGRIFELSQADGD